MLRIYFLWFGFYAITCIQKHLKYHLPYIYTDVTKQNFEAYIEKNALERIKHTFSSTSSSYKSINSVSIHQSTIFVCYFRHFSFWFIAQSYAYLFFEHKSKLIGVTVFNGKKEAFVRQEKKKKIYIIHYCVCCYKVLFYDRSSANHKVIAYRIHTFSAFFVFLVLIMACIVFPVYMIDGIPSLYTLFADQILSVFSIRIQSSNPFER